MYKNRFIPKKSGINRKDGPPEQFVCTDAHKLNRTVQSDQLYTQVSLAMHISLTGRQRDNRESGDERVIEQIWNVCW